MGGPAVVAENARDSSPLTVPAGCRMVTAMTGLLTICGICRGIIR